LGIDDTAQYGIHHHINISTPAAVLQRK